MSQCTRERLPAQVVEAAMEQHDGLVHAFIQRQGGGDISYEEALQAGRIGLWHTIQGYDPARGTAFSTYAWVAIYRRIHRRAKELSQGTEVLSAEIAGSWVLPDPAGELERELVHDVLHELVGQLPKRLCQVIVER
jgi:RNA polymerase sigma factor (sigma-70 family)